MALSDFRREGFFVAMKRDSIAIIGLGKVGTALGFLLRSAGYEIAAVSDVSPESLIRGVEFTGGKAFADASQAASEADTIFITTWDDAIETTCEEISQKDSIRPGDKVVHVSGAGGLDILASARKCGACVASIHPLQSFADTKSAIENLPGSTFGITANDEIYDWAVEIVTALGGTHFSVAEEDKPLHHAAACMASNYLVTLMSIVEQIYQSLGLKEDTAMKAFWPLVKGTIKNIEKKGIAPSLTGPIARGDIGTLKKHLRVFHTKYPSLLPLYREMGIFTADIGLHNKTLSEERAQEIKTLLREEQNDE
jgi:predicted short-subunit dehydrogenase-like oxidoreductase (DUF2520 family)